MNYEIRYNEKEVLSVIELSSTSNIVTLVPPSGINYSSITTDNLPNAKKQLEALGLKNVILLNEYIQ